MTPAEIVTGVQSGDTDAEAHLFRLVWQYRGNRSIDTESAEDLAQDVALKCWVSIHAGEVRNPDSLAAFVGTVHRNAKLIWLRGRRPDPLELREIPDRRTPEALLLRQERDALLMRAVGDLAPRDREIVMRWAHGETLAEVALAIGVDAGRREDGALPGTAAVGKGSQAMNEFAFIDMDGVIADFVSGVCVAHGRSSPYENTPGALGNFEMHEIWGISTNAFWKPCDGERFWDDLGKTPEAEEIVRVVCGVFGTNNCAILTSPSIEPLLRTWETAMDAATLSRIAGFDDIHRR